MASSDPPEGQAAPSFLRIYWLDYCAVPRMRAIPMRKVGELLASNDSLSIGITKASLGLLPNDTIVGGASATGEYRLHPDFASLRWGPRAGHISAWGQFREPDGTPATLCPRTILRWTVAEAARHGLAFQLGFEIELVVMARHVLTDSLGMPVEEYRPIFNDGHAWSVARATDLPVASTIIERAVAALADVGIHVEQYHPESAPGQFEIVLPRAAPLEAVETLLHARDVISNIAAAAPAAEGGPWRVTLHPKPFPDACGTAAHLHMSISTGPDGVPAGPSTYEPFYAGIMSHLRAIVALSYPNPASYDRIVDGAWAGGRWVAWGTQNRETPLRAIDGSHWEIKCNDGLSNPYLVVAALIAAGTRGFVDGEPLTWGDCEVDPAQLTDNDRFELGVSEMLPASLPEALDALQADDVLREALGDDFVERYVGVKTAELRLMGSMNDGLRRQWIMARY
jgi:glutamine synthetase